MLFEWDESKRQANFGKYHVDFRDAKQVRDGPGFERLDRRRGEDRVFAIGLMEDIEVSPGTPVRDSEGVPGSYNHPQGVAGA
jgi:uncharacterized DUF497 family protein